LLTRLKVQGFKNLVDVDVRFGPFTCIAGSNGVGKSNLFDAIAFLRALADKPLLDAALCVRDETGRSGDVRGLFHRVGDDYDDQMSFQTEMIVPSVGTDDLGQKAEATITFLKYEITLRFRRDNGARSLGGLELVSEKLSHVRKGEAHSHLKFPHKPNTWRKSAITGRIRGHRTADFISTEGADDDDKRTIKMHQEGAGGRPHSYLATQLPRTVLSAANAAEGPTATLARREMQSWRILQLEPSSLRQPDPFTAPSQLGADGAHLAATLYRLTRPVGTNSSDDVNPLDRETRVCAQVSNRLSQLIEDVRAVRIDRDEVRELLTLNVKGRDGTVYPARALSDGTLRFLALAVLELDPQATGVLCLEEPENGIHPARIPAILDLLKAIATDAEAVLGDDNPLRQVIVNTHSPVVVGQVDDQDLLLAELREAVRDKGQRRFKRLSFSCLPGTWRANGENESGTHLASRGALLAYLTPFAQKIVTSRSRRASKRRRVLDREDLQLPLFGDEG
jgi:predicted ATPase